LFWWHRHFLESAWIDGFVAIGQVRIAEARRPVKLDARVAKEPARMGFHASHDRRRICDILPSVGQHLLILEVVA
jgi:hypothetical protein